MGKFLQGQKCPWANFCDTNADTYLFEVLTFLLD